MSPAYQMAGHRDAAVNGLAPADLKAPVMNAARCPVSSSATREITAATCALSQEDSRAVGNGGRRPVCMFMRWPPPGRERTLLPHSARSVEIIEPPTGSPTGMRYELSSKKVFVALRA